jgi:predicted amidohydrolase
MTSTTGGIEKYGRTLDAFWPVVDTEIGRLGIMMANEGSYPENARALALNGAEVVYRASYHIRLRAMRCSRSRAAPGPSTITCILLRPNMGTYYLFPEETTSIEPFGGRSYIIDYKAASSGSRTTGLVRPTWEA